ALVPLSGGRLVVEGTTQAANWTAGVDRYPLSPVGRPGAARVLASAPVLGTPAYKLVVPSPPPEGENPVRDQAYPGASKTLAAVFADWEKPEHPGHVLLWDAGGRKERLRLEGHTAAVLSVALSADGKTAATGCADGTVWLWDAATGKRLATLKGHKEAVRL